jgi:hypothetical protein
MEKYMRLERTEIVTMFRMILAFGVAAPLGVLAENAAGQTAPPISISSSVPAELNPPFVAGPPSTGGAPAATPEQASAFAWQEFIALNWPAGPQEGKLGQRDAPSSTCKFGDPAAECGLLVWETMRHKVEIFPGNGSPIFVVTPPGYDGSTKADSWGYDALGADGRPVYNYQSGAVTGACDQNQANDPTPWVNLDETDQITLDTMYAGVVKADSSPGNSSPKLVRFTVKANRTQYFYVADNSSATDASNQWWYQIPFPVVKATKSYLEVNKASPEAGSSTMISLPNGAIEIKAGWRPLNPSESSSGRFHTQTVRFYEYSGGPMSPPGSPVCYRDATWGLVALHIIQKTPSAPYFIYATFEQADNILTSDGQPVEDADGAIIAEQQHATTPQVCLNDPVPNPTNTNSTPSVSGTVIITSDPKTCKTAVAEDYCKDPTRRLYYINTAFPPTNNQPSGGKICVDKRDNAIPDYVVKANRNAHTTIASYLQQNGINSAPWLSYKLINVQYYPYDKIPDPSKPNGSLYTANEPYSASNPAASSYYQANIVVETNRSLQLFAGGLSPNISTEWNQDGSFHKNTYYGGKFNNMGGCMGCHGSQGQNPAGQAGDFSVILARGNLGTFAPEAPAFETSEGLTTVKRNRTLR